MASGADAGGTEEVEEAAAQLGELLQNLLEVQSLLEADPGNEELTALRDELVVNCQELEELVSSVELAEGGRAAACEDDEDAGPVAGPALPPGAADAAPRRTNLPHSEAHGNKGIHPRSVYSAGAPNFAELAKKQPVLQPFLAFGKDKKAYIDFKSFEATRALTCALLKEDFGVSWWLPEGHLCPTMTNRTNYIHWIEDLLALSGPPVEKIRGIDIGVGANAVYTLLGAAMCGWHMVGTDVTDSALQGAQMNVSANPHLGKLIQLRDARSKESSTGDHVLQGVVRPGDPPFAFCMCNPPFFESIEEAGQNPNTLAFIHRIVADSWKLQKRVWWYTTMVGKKSTLKTLLGELRRAGGPPALRTTELSQGKTTRWCLAWSFAKEAAAADRTPLNKAPGLTAAPVLLKPCNKANTTVRVGREKGAAVLALQVILEAAQGMDDVSDLKTDAATFCLSGTLEISGAGGAPDAKRAKGAEGPKKGKGGPPAFTATVLQSAPGELTVRAALVGDAAGSAEAQAAFAQAFAGMQRALRDKWPQPL